MNRWVSLIILSLIFSGCNRNKDNKGSGKKFGQSLGKKKDRLNRAPIVLPVVASRFELGDISSYYKSYTTIKSKNYIRIPLEAPGKVKDIFVQIGDTVKKNQPLARLDYEEKEAELRLRKIRLSQAKRDLDHKRNLYKGKLISRIELENAEVAYEEAKYNHFRSLDGVRKTWLRSPVDGIVAENHLTQFNFYTANTHGFSVVTVDQLEAELFIPENGSVDLKLDSTVQVTTVRTANPTTLPGKIAAISPIISPESGTIQVKIMIPNKEQKIRHGQFVEIGLLMGEKQGVVKIPRKVVTEENRKKIYYTLTKLSSSESDKLLSDLQKDWDEVADEKKKPFFRKKKDSEQSNKMTPRPTEIPPHTYKVRKVNFVAGLTNRSYVEIIDGAVAGQMYISEGFEGLKEGTFVRVINAKDIQPLVEKRKK